jgi:hypothetical protein
MMTDAAASWARRDKRRLQMPPSKPCRRFAPDSLGGNPLVCIACLWHVADHSDAFAMGYIDGFEGRRENIFSLGRADDYRSGRAQGAIDAARPHVEP